MLDRWNYADKDRSCPRRPGIAKKKVTKSIDIVIIRIVKALLGSEVVFDIWKLK